MFTKGYSEIWVSSNDGNEFNGKIMANGIDLEDRLGNEFVLKWEVFDEIDSLFCEHGERVRKGDARRYKLGQSGLGIDTIEGRIAFKVYNKGLGDVVRERIEVIEKILVSTGYFQSEGEYIKVVHPEQKRKVSESNNAYGIAINKHKSQNNDETIEKVKETKQVKKNVVKKEKGREVQIKKREDRDLDVSNNKEKYGKLVIDTIKKLSNENMINPFAVNFLLDDKHSADTFDINSSFLKEYSRDKNLYEQRYRDNGDRISYYSEILTINEEEYLLYNDWNENSKEKFLKWLKKLLRSAKK